MAAAVSSPVWPLDDVAGSPPEPELLTSRILRALAEEGLLADDISEQTRLAAHAWPGSRRHQPSRSSPRTP